MSVAAAPVGDSVQARELTDADYRFLRDLVYARSGITLGDHKQRLVQGRLQRRLRHLGLETFAAYCDWVRQHPDTELDALLSAVSTNVTRFYREAHHFDYLAQELLPRLLAASPSPRLRIWSAGCATGEEAYTLAMVLEQALAAHGRAIDALILATDLSLEALAIAQAGIYRLEQLADVPTEMLSRWFKRGTGMHDGQAMVRPELRSLIRFQALNLLEPWPMRGQFDLIFCRNVVIYFDRDGKRRLFARFAGQLKPDGYVFLGHSESMAGVSDDFELVGRSIYRLRHDELS